MLQFVPMKIRNIFAPKLAINTKLFYYRTENSNYKLSFIFYIKSIDFIFWKECICYWIFKPYIISYLQSKVFLILENTFFNKVKRTGEVFYYF